MTSVLSHRRLLSGSNMLLFIACISLLTACGSTKTTTRPTSDVPQDKPPKIDLPDMTVDPDPRDTLIVKVPDIDPIDERFGPQKSMTVALLIPLGAEAYYPGDYQFSSEQEKFIQFYQGALMALDQWRDKGIDLSVETIDTKSAVDPLKTLDALKPDAVLGAYEGTMIKELARWAKENQTIAISPWRSSSTVTQSNPYFVQVNPTLDQYLHAIASHVAKNYADHQVVLIGKDDEQDRQLLSKVQGFKKAVLMDDQVTPWKEFYLDPVQFEPDEEGEIDWEPLTDLFYKNGNSIFVIPHYRSTSWIKNALNKIAAAKDLNRLSIYGMSNWMDIEDVSFSQRIFLDLHLPVYQHVDRNKAEIQYLERQYLQKYNMLPTADEAYLGYDLVDFITNAWMQHGTNAIIESGRSASSGLSVQLDVQPIYSPGEDISIDYFQNVLIQMYRYTKNGLQSSNK